MDPVNAFKPLERPPAIAPVVAPPNTSPPLIPDVSAPVPAPIATLASASLMLLFIAAWFTVPVNWSNAPLSATFFNTVVGSCPIAIELPACRSIGAAALATSKLKPLVTRAWVTPLSAPPVMPPIAAPVNAPFTMSSPVRAALAPPSAPPTVAPLTAALPSAAVVKAV